MRVQRNITKAYVRHGFRCKIFNEECSLGGPKGSCWWALPHYVAKDPWNRRGTLRIEARSGVRQALTAAVRDANTGNDLDGLLMPAPYRECMCWMCG